MHENRPEMYFQLVSELAVPFTKGMGTGYTSFKSKGLTKWDNLLVRVGRERDKAAFSEL